MTVAEQLSVPSHVRGNEGDPGRKRLERDERKAFPPRRDHYRIGRPDKASRLGLCPHATNPRLRAEVRDELIQWCSQRAVADEHEPRPGQRGHGADRRCVILLRDKATGGDNQRDVGGDAEAAGQLSPRGGCRGGRDAVHDGRDPAHAMVTQRRFDTGTTGDAREAGQPHDPRASLVVLFRHAVHAHDHRTPRASARHGRRHKCHRWVVAMDDVGRPSPHDRGERRDCRRKLADIAL